MQNTKTDYDVVLSNSTSSAGGLYTWDLLEMAINSNGTDAPSCYIEFIPIAGDSKPQPSTLWVTAKPTTSKVTVNGNKIEFDSYNINGDNYFKLRDLGTTFNIGVDWNNLEKTVEIDTSKVYTEE